MNIPFDGNYPVTQRFGETLTNPAGHTGIDYALYKGTPVLAAMDGIVIRTARLTTGYGVHVIMDHGNGLQTIYAHLSSIAVLTGQKIKAGEELGRSGDTGNSTGPHLHFEIRRHGTPVDPEDYLQPMDNDPEPGTSRISVPMLYVRSGPGTEFQIVDSLNRGDRVTGTEKVETVWMKIGPDRWIAARYQGRDFCETIA